MAHFLIQPRDERWCIPEVHFLNLTKNEDKTKLIELRSNSENVIKVPFTDVKTKFFAIIEGNVISAYSKSVLKVGILKRAVQEHWTHEEAMKALYELKPSERREILENTKEE